MAGEVAAAAISAAANIGSQIYNSSQAGNLNAANRKWQELQMSKQRNWAIEDWYKQSQQQRALLQMSQDWDAAEWTRRFNEENAYNDPSRQMSRLRAAGINPYYALGMMDNGAASGVAGPGVSAAAAPGVRQSQYAPNLEQKYSPIDLGASVDRFTDSLLRQEQVKSAQLQNAKQTQENAFNATRYQYELNKMAFHDKELKAQMPYIDQLVDLNWRQANASYENTLANTASLYTSQETQRQNVTLAKLQYDMAKELQAFNIREGKRMNNATIQNLAALTSSYVQQAGFYRASSFNQYKQGWMHAAQTLGIKIDNQLKEWATPYLLSGYQSDAAMKEEGVKNATWQNSPYPRYIAPNLGSLINAAGQAASFYLGFKTLGLKESGKIGNKYQWNTFNNPYTNYYY